MDGSRSPTKVGVAASNVAMAGLPFPADGAKNSNSVNLSVTLGKASGDPARDRCEWRARQYHREREACDAESAFPPFLLNVHWLSFCLFTCWSNVPSSNMGRGHIARRCISEIPGTNG
jgi:hypothetical protein